MMFGLPYPVSKKIGGGIVDSIGLAGIVTMWCGPTPDLHERFVPPVVFIIKL